MKRKTLRAVDRHVADLERDLAADLEDVLVEHVGEPQLEAAAMSMKKTRSLGPSAGSTGSIEEEAAAAADARVAGLVDPGAVGPVDLTRPLAKRR